MNLFTALFILVIACYGLMIVTSGKTKEGFVANLLWLPDDRPRNPEKVIMEQHIEAPYVTSPIYGVDDYDLNVVYQNEGDREMSKKRLNKLTAQYPLDWSTHPPSSAVFQKGMNEMNEMKEGFQDTTNNDSKPFTLNPYKEVDGSSLTPPDTSATELEERKILQTYTPAKAESLTTYDLEDAKHLISKIYDAKGLIPTVVQKPNNVFEVIGVRKKDEKIVYEDEEAPATTAAVAAAGEANITVPPVAADVAAGLDPFFTPSEGASRTNRWDYTRWSPGLERTFAPTHGQEKWF
jgi:hypothetical protein